MSEERSKSIEVLVIGHSEVDKTSIVRQLRGISDNIFDSEYKRKGDATDVERNTYEQMCFTEVTSFPYPSFRRLFIKTSDAFILTYNADSEISLEYATSFIEEIKDIKGQDVPIIVAANKTDTQRDEQYDIAGIVTAYLECKHVEVCSADGEGMKDLFSCLLGYFGQYFIYPEDNGNIYATKRTLSKKLLKFFRSKLSKRKSQFR